MRMRTRLRNMLWLGALALGVSVTADPAVGTSGRDSRPSSTQGQSAAYRTDLRGFHLEANRGQTDPAVRFLARARGYTAFLCDGEAVFALRGPRREGQADTEAVVRMRFPGALPSPEVLSLDPLPGRSNYLIGSDLSKWIREVPHCGGAVSRNLHPGTDMAWRCNAEGRLEYEFRVAPGADPASIVLEFAGARDLAIGEDGVLRIATAIGELRHSRPVLYEVANGRRKPVEGGFALLGKDRVGFRVAGRNPALSLVIDPQVEFSTYLGGTGNDRGRGVAVDGSGACYVTGVTPSSDFPVQSPLQGTSGGNDDAFVSKFNATGSSLVYSTFIGGSGDDRGNGIAVDTTGSVCVAGETGSTNFPLQSAFQGTMGDTSGDCFVLKITSTGSSLSYSSYLGGNNTDTARAVAVDGNGTAYVTGTTNSTNFPTKSPFQSTYGGGGDVFLSVISSGGSLTASTYLGGSADDVDGVVAVDANGNVAVAGATFSTDFPVKSALQGSHAVDGSGTPTSKDAFVAKFGSSGLSLLWATYLGGDKYDMAYGVAIDGSGAVYVTGFTSSTDFPTKGPLKGSRSGISDAFATKIDASGASLAYSIYLGGSSSEWGNGVAVDRSGRAFFLGRTDSTNFPTLNPVQGSKGGSMDAYVSVLNAAGDAFVYSTYFGGSGNDYLSDFGQAIALDGTGAATVVGYTRSTDFPTQAPFQSTHAGGTDDAFVFRLSGDGGSSVPPPAAPSDLTALTAINYPVQLDWADHSDNETAFQVERRFALEPFEVVGTAGPNATGFADSTIAALTTYTYRVRAVNGGGSSDWSNEATITTMAMVPAPGAPADLVALPVSESRIDLQWSDSSVNEIAFEIQRRAGTGGFATIQSMGAGGTTFEDRGLLPDRTYTYRIRAVGLSNASAYAPEASATTLPTLGVLVVKGALTDSSRAGKDKVAVSGSYSFAEGAPDGTLDPAADGVRFFFTAGGVTMDLAIPGSADTWKVRKGVYTWKSPKGSTTKYKVKVDTVRGTFQVAVSGVDLAGAPGNPFRTGFGSGNDGGFQLAAWTEKKTGLYKYP